MLNKKIDVEKKTSKSKKINIKKSDKRKKTLNPNLLNPIYRIRIYTYILTTFLALYLISLIYVIHQNRYFIATKINHINIIKEQFKNDEIINEYKVNDNIESNSGYGDDNYITKFVNNKISFYNLSYIPKNLVKVESDYVEDIKWNQTLRSEANQALQQMAKDFFDNFWEKIVVVSTYRSYDYQVWIKSRWCSDLFCAKAWFSEHQTGLATDLWEASTQKEFLNNSKFVKYFEWMKANAYKYGFHNTYQKGVAVDWYVVEPWHWRYLWVSLAKKLFDDNITFAEYYKNSK